MGAPAIEHLTDIEKRTSFYLERIRKIDSILEGPTLTLISIAAEGLATEKSSPSRKKRRKKRPVYFPIWKSETVQPERVDHLLTQALCSSTLQRLWRLRRRFPWLDKHPRFGEIHELLVGSLIPENPKRFNKCIERLNSQTFGCLNPLTASQVFRVFLSAGEDHAHGTMGFLAFFAMVWPLFRRFPDPLNIGASIEPWEPTTYVTANCLLPIKTLQSICIKRARLLGRVATNMEKLRELAPQQAQRERWLFNLELDELSANLARLSEVAIVREEFRKCAESVGTLSDKTTGKFDNSVTYSAVFKSVGKALKSVGKRASSVLAEAESITNNIEEEIINRLPGAGRKNRRGDYPHLEDWGFKFAKEFIIDRKHNREYWRDLRQAAVKSLKLCRNALGKLQAGTEYCLGVNVDDDNSIIHTINEVKRTNEEVARYFDPPLRDAALWCRSVVDREIAHASAKNFTDFDPSELVNAIAVAVRWELMTTSLQVSDAVRRALEGVLPDGSWRSGQPFFSPNHVTGIWPVTSDTVWTLASAIELHPEVDVADEALFLYVDWLDRTKTKLTQEPDQSVIGWASDRLRHRRKVHLATTAYSINALLEIRDLSEYRLWQLCEERFTVIRNVKGLKDIDPVDLRAPHGDRLHSHLARMARYAQDPSCENALYSLVLHGPPGSSKTSVAEAMSAGMWTASSRWGAKEPRLVRITPADFTRLGEDRLDSEARMIFELLSHIRAVTILFDEIDDLLRDRNSETARSFPPRFMDLVVPAMLNRLGDLRSVCRRQELCFLLGTNYVERIEPALIRKGRIDRCVAVVYPDRNSRLAIIGRHVDRIRKESQGEKNLQDAKTLKGIAVVIESLADDIASGTKQWPWMTIDSTCDDISKDERLRSEVKKTLANGGAAGLRRLLRKTDNPIVKIIKEILTTNKSSFSEPEYGILHWGGRFCQQLLDEYLHHLMSRFDRRTECEKHLRGEAEKIEELDKIPYWHKGIKFVIDRAMAVWK